MIASTGPLTLLAGAAHASWVYTWPYSGNNTCQCVQSELGGYLNFDTPESCLSAFAEDPAEFCTSNGEGFSQHHCSFAVSTAPGVYNSDCQKICVEYVAGAMTLSEFQGACKLELPASVAGSALVNPSDSCFSNYVYGWADYNAQNTLQHPPIKIYHQVDTAAECQELCQFTGNCVYFNWRAAADSDDSVATQQSPLYTCLLYDQTYIDGVLATRVDSTTGISGSSEFCDATGLQSTCPLDYLSGEFFYPFVGDKCLLCGCMSKCAWKSNSHITGPALCASTSVPRDHCGFQRSNWFVRTTTAAPACPADTKTCAEPPTAHATALPEGTSTLVPATPERTGTTIQVDDTTTGLDLEPTTASVPTRNADTVPAGPQDRVVVPSAKPAPADECDEDCDGDDDCEDDGCEDSCENDC